MMTFINIVLFACIFISLARTGTELVQFDEKSKNIYNIKTKKYLFMKVFFIILTFLTSIYMIKKLNGNEIVEGIKLGIVFSFFELYRKNIINSLKRANRIQIEEQIENIRYEYHKDKNNAIKSFKTLNVKDDYKYYNISKDINNDYMGILLIDKKNDKKRYAYKLFFY